MHWAEVKPDGRIDGPDVLCRTLSLAFPCLCLSVQHLPVEIARFDLHTQTQ